MPAAPLRQSPRETGPASKERVVKLRQELSAGNRRGRVRALGASFFGGAGTCEEVDKIRGRSARSQTAPGLELALCQGEHIESPVERFALSPRPRGFKAPAPAHRTGPPPDKECRERSVSAVSRLGSAPWQGACLAVSAITSATTATTLTVRLRTRIRCPDIENARWRRHSKTNRRRAYVTATGARVIAARTDPAGAQPPSAGPEAIEKGLARRRESPGWPSPWVAVPRGKVGRPRVLSVLDENHGEPTASGRARCSLGDHAEADHHFRNRDRGAAARPAVASASSLVRCESVCRPDRPLVSSRIQAEQQ